MRFSFSVPVAEYGISGEPMARQIRGRHEDGVLRRGKAVAQLAEPVVVPCGPGDDHEAGQGAGLSSTSSTTLTALTKLTERTEGYTRMWSTPRRCFCPPSRAFVV